MAGQKSGYAFPILNSDGSASGTQVDFEDMFVRKELFYDAGLWGWGHSSEGIVYLTSIHLSRDRLPRIGGDTPGVREPTCSDVL